MDLLPRRLWIFQGLQFLKFRKLESQTIVVNVRETSLRTKVPCRPARKTSSRSDHLDVAARLELLTYTTASAVPLKRHHHAIRSPAHSAAPSNCPDFVKQKLRVRLVGLPQLRLLSGLRRQPLPPQPRQRQPPLGLERVRRRLVAAQR